MRTPTASLQKRYEELTRWHEADRSLTIATLSRRWGCAPGTASARLTLMRACDGLNVPTLKRSAYGASAVRQSIHIVKTTHNHSRSAVKGTVDASCLGDPTMPECPACRKANRVSFHGRRPHLVQDKDGFIYCEACAYTLEFMSFEDKPMMEVA